MTRPLIALALAAMLASGVWAQIELRASMDWITEQMECEE